MDREKITAPGRIYVVDRNNILMTDIATEGGYYIPFSFGDEDKLEEIPFVKALLLVEDKNYFSHFGIDTFAKLRALKDNILYGKITSGGSTLTEQWIKNHFFQGVPRTYSQKLREAQFAFFFSLIMDKRDILEQYLNSFYLGNNIFGIQTAIEVYFGKKDLGDLNEEEITLLISLIHTPSVSTLQEKSFLSYEEKIKEKLGYTFVSEIETLNKKENIDLFPFISMKAKNICRGIRDSQFIFFTKIDCTQMIFQSTIDAKLSLFSREISANVLSGLEGKNVTNSAIFGVRPLTNEVILYEGSRDFYTKKTDGQVDVITSERQMGSTMKPFLYLLALKNGFSPDDLLLDIESEYNSFQKDTSYISENYSLKEYGLVKLKKALGNSFNNASVRLAKELGLGKVYENYKSFGISLPFGPDYYGYSLVLGNPSITLKSLVGAYMQLLPKPEKGGEIDEDKFLLYTILSDSDNRDMSFGVNSILNTSILQAVKTGTSSDFKDNLTVSYHPNLVLGVWVGNNDSSSMLGVTGITGAGYIWHQTIEKAIQLGIIYNGTIPMPGGLETSNYCLDIRCYQKEIIIKKKGKEYYSRPRDNTYDIRDLGEKLSLQEKKRVAELGFYLK